MKFYRFIVCVVLGFLGPICDGDLLPLEVVKDKLTSFFSKEEVEEMCHISEPGDGLWRLKANLWNVFNSDFSEKTQLQMWGLLLNLAVLQMQPGCKDSELCDTISRELGNWDDEAQKACEDDGISFAGLEARFTSCGGKKLDSPNTSGGEDSD